MKHVFRKCRVLALAASVLAALIGTAACDHKVLLHAYEPTSLEGWEKNDSLIFPLDTIRHTGTYKFELGFRTTSAYPYQNLWMVIETELVNPADLQRDTLECKLFTAHGDVTGQGVSTYQYTFPIEEKMLHEGQSGKVRIRHIMRREILPGLSDVGIHIERK